MAPSLTFTIPLLIVVASTSFLVQILLKNSPVDPLPLHFPPILHDFDGIHAVLQNVEKLGEGLFYGPEDIAFDQEGRLYTATRDGWIWRMWPNGTWETWNYVGGRPLGLRVVSQEEILILEPSMGLLRVTSGNVTILSNEVDGIAVRFVDELMITRGGVIYFTDASTKFGYDRWFLDVLEARPHARLLRYDPTTRQTKIILRDLAFGNGVEVSEDEDYLLVCETWKCRCLKYWLEGERQGTTEVFMEGMPGGPDNIHRNSDGTYWIAQLMVRSPLMEMIHRSPFIKRLLAMLPWLLNRLNPVHKRAALLKVAADGKPLLYLEDPKGKTMSFVTTGFQHGNSLYLASLDANFIGRIHLP